MHSIAERRHEAKLRAPKGNLLRISRFLDSLRSLGMTPHEKAILTLRLLVFYCSADLINSPNFSGHFWYPFDSAQSHSLPD